MIKQCACHTELTTTSAAAATAPAAGTSAATAKPSLVPLKGKRGGVTLNIMPL